MTAFGRAIRMVGGHPDAAGNKQFEAVQRKRPGEVVGQAAGYQPPGEVCGIQDAYHRHRGAAGKADVVVEVAGQPEAQPLAHVGRVDVVDQRGGRLQYVPIRVDHNGLYEGFGGHWRSS